MSFPFYTKKMLKEIFKETIVIDSINFVIGVATYKKKLISAKENLSADALPELFSAAGEFVPTKGGKMYILPGATIPRFKLREFLKQEDMSIAKGPQGAKVAVVGEDTPLSIVKAVTYSYCYDKDDILRTLSKGPKTTSLITLAEELRRSDVNEDVMVETYSVMQAIHVFHNANLHYSPSTNQAFVWIADEAALDNFEKVMELNLPIINEDSILKHLGSGTTMDKSLFDNMCGMFNSSDSSNHILAMEAMANCDYEKSAVYLLQLISRYAIKMKNCKEVKHVNFISMLKFFGMKEPVVMQIDTIMGKMIERKLLNSTAKSEILRLAAENIDLEVDSCYFMADVKLKEEYELEIEKGDEYMKSREEGKEDLTPDLEKDEEENQQNTNTFEL